MIINFIGDLIFGDQPIKFGYGFDSTHYKNKYKGIFKGVNDSLQKADYNVGNFESIIKTRTSSNNISNWAMCCDENIINELKSAKINVLNVANNHTIDFGAEWFRNTISKISSAGIKVIGLREKPYEILTINNEKAVIIGVSYLKINKKNPLFFYRPKEKNWIELFNEIEKLNISNIFLSIHWGNEFIKNPSQNQIDILDILYKFNFSGIIGHHPHILQPACLMKKTPVFFSLGNFISDYWQARARTTQIVQCHLKNKKITYWGTIPCIINKKGLPNTIGELESVFFDTGISIASKKDISIARNRLRKEYFLELITHFILIKNKISFLKWLISRLNYIIKYYRKEKNNPDLIYEKYKNH